MHVSGWIADLVDEWDGKWLDDLGEWFGEFWFGARDRVHTLHKCHPDSAVMLMLMRILIFQILYAAIRDLRQTAASGW